MANKVQTPKGFRDFLPPESSRRIFVLEKLRSIFEKSGFEPLETPAIEYADTLKGKYGDEEKLIYEFTDRGNRQIALRYDQTVPLARVFSQNVLPTPFKRYQIQPVWRAENTQKGRYREFLQVDIDTVGTESLMSDAEIVVTAIDSIKALGFSDFTMKINDRSIFDGLSPSIIRSLDKLKKIGELGVLEQIKREGYDTAQAKALLKQIRDSSPTAEVEKMFAILVDLGVEKDKFAFDPTLARGLDYYTSLIFELEIEGYSGGSIGGGGRYDNLIGRFADRKIPAVGFSFGFDRLLECMKEQSIFKSDPTVTKVLVTIFSPQLQNESVAIVKRLRGKNINSEIYLQTDDKLEKQLKYADSKKIPFAIILGPEELKEGKVTLKKLSSGTQETIKESDAVKQLTRV